MKRIIPRQLIYVPEYRIDAERIVMICVASDIEVSINDAYYIWKYYSEIMAAGWLTLPVDDKRVLQIVLKHSQYVKEI